jgi:lysophospholipase L1-like esterase
LLDLRATLPHTAQRLARGEALTLIALGSSSTAGTGASDPTRTYPAQLALALGARFPRSRIHVHNAGRGGEETTQMVQRLRRDVLEHAPDLVIWQVGTNALLRGTAAETIDRDLTSGLAMLKAADTDVILMDPQYAPKVIAKPNYAGIIDEIDAFARAQHVGLFQRFQIMQHWSQVRQFDFARMLSADQLHMNDASYHCIGQLLGNAIARAVTQPGTPNGRVALDRPPLRGPQETPR